MGGRYAEEFATSFVLLPTPHILGVYIHISTYPIFLLIYLPTYLSIHLSICFGVSEERMGFGGLGTHDMTREWIKSIPPLLLFLLSMGPLQPLYIYIWLTQAFFFWASRRQWGGGGSREKEHIGHCVYRPGSVENVYEYHARGVSGRRPCVLCSYMI